MIRRMDTGLRGTDREAPQLLRAVHSRVHYDWTVPGGACPVPRNPSAWPSRNRRLRGRLAATAHAAGRRALAVRGARRQLRNSRGVGGPLARFASRTHVRPVPEGALPPRLRHVLTIRNVFASPIGLTQATGQRTTDSGLSSAGEATKRAETKPAPARVRHSGPRTERLRSGGPESPLFRGRTPLARTRNKSPPCLQPLASGCLHPVGRLSRDECPWNRTRPDGSSIRRKAFRARPVPATISKSAGNEKMPG